MNKFKVGDIVKSKENNLDIRYEVIEIDPTLLKRLSDGDYFYSIRDNELEKETIMENTMNKNKCSHTNYEPTELEKETIEKVTMYKEGIDAFNYYKDKEKIIRKAKLEIIAAVNVKLQDLLFQYSDTGVGHKLTFDVGFMLGELHKEIGVTENDE
jgi:hypothetical protein